LSAGRQAHDTHQGCRCRGGRAHLGHTIREGTDGRRSVRSLQLQALEGKDVKDLLLNVGSGGGAAAAAAPGGPAAGGEAAAEEKEEEKEEGRYLLDYWSAQLTPCREGGVRRRHGLRSVRLGCGSVFLRPGSVTSAWGCMMYLYFGKMHGGHAEMNANSLLEAIACVGMPLTCLQTRSSSTSYPDLQPGMRKQ
jgi:hypothetical protein